MQCHFDVTFFCFLSFDLFDYVAPCLLQLTPEYALGVFSANEVRSSIVK